VPNVVNVADGETPPILNAESVLRCDGPYDVGCHHAVATPEDNNPRSSILLLA
jgi:hypothetical protein